MTLETISLLLQALSWVCLSGKWNSRNIRTPSHHSWWVNIFSEQVCYEQSKILVTVLIIIFFFINTNLFINTCLSTWGNLPLAELFCKLGIQTVPGRKEWADWVTTSAAGERSLNFILVGNTWTSYLTFFCVGLSGLHHWEYRRIKWTGFYL